MKTTWLIGCVCKGGDVFSLAVLIDRGLDLQISNEARTLIWRGTVRCTGKREGSTFWIVTLFSSEGSQRSSPDGGLSCMETLLHAWWGRSPGHVHRVSVDDGEGTPVPIPNTAVKLTRADNTWLEAAW